MAFKIVAIAYIILMENSSRIRLKFKCFSFVKEKYTVVINQVVINAVC